MRILYVCTFYERAMIFRDAMNYLEQRGHSLTAFNAVPKGTVIDDKYKPIMDEKVIHRECFTRYDRYVFPIKQKKIKESIENNIDISRFDLIHSHTLFNGGWATYQLNRKYDIPYVVTVRNTDVNIFLKIPFFKMIAVKILDHASGVLFLSEPYRDKVLKQCFKKNDRERILKKCAVIPNGLEPFWIENINKPKKITSPVDLLYVGRVDRNKNIETTLKVLELLNEEGIDTRLTVVGQIMYDSAKQSLEQNVHTTVVPFMDKEELVRYYRNGDIFIMPSFHESFGRVYVEAMTQGTPVIYTRGEGFDNTFPEGTVGYSVKPDSIEEIAASVKRIIKDYPEISKNCIDNCRMFDWVMIAQQLEEFYTQAIASTNR